MKKYLKTSFWASLAAVLLLFAIRGIESWLGQYLYPQWETLLAGAIFLTFCLLTTITGTGGHKSAHHYATGNKETEGYAFNIPLLTTALGFFLAGTIISRIDDDWTGASINLLFLLIAMIFIAKIMLLMMHNYGALVGRRPALIPALTMDRLGNLFKNILLQTVTTFVLIAADSYLLRLIGL